MTRHRAAEPAGTGARSSRCRASSAETRALDIRGEINAIGAPAFVDLVGELRSFKLPSVDPYMAANTGWIIKKGELQYKVRFKLEGDQLSADNEVVVGSSRWRRPAAATRSSGASGCPLGLIVALIKDQKGDIRATFPSPARSRIPSSAFATPSGPPSRTCW